MLLPRTTILEPLLRAQARFHQVTEHLRAHLPGRYRNALILRAVLGLQCRHLGVGIDGGDRHHHARRPAMRIMGVGEAARHASADEGPYHPCCREKLSAHTYTPSHATHVPMRFYTPP